MKNITDENGKIISTHALTWSATHVTCSDGQTTQISTHALTWSAT